MKKTVVLVSALFGVLLLSSCGLREGKVHQQMQEQNEEAENARHEQKTLSDQDAALVKQDFEAKRAYFYALAGEYSGSFSLQQANLPGAPAPAPSSPSAFAGTPSAASTLIYVQFIVQNDADNLPTNQDLTADQVSAEAAALTLSLNVIEETNALNAQGQPISVRNECAESGAKPDIKTGEISFTCQSASGRNYVFSLDDGSPSPRTVQTMLSRSIEASQQLLSGGLNKLPAMNVQISTSFSQNFFGTLQRTGSK